jgi:hypothetical protein
VPNNKVNFKDSNNNLNVEDISGDELSITSVKGEGFASDLSDNELKNQHQNQQQLLVNKRAKLKNNLKRPTTPMDVRNSGDGHQNHQPSAQQQKSASKQNSSLLQTQHQHQINSSGGVVVGGVGGGGGGGGGGVGGLKYHQLGDQNVTSTRFNEWDPYSANRQQQLSQSERQKSPLKSKQSMQQNQNSSFAHTFLNTDSSPRQTSGRSQVGSAGNQKLQQISPQQQQALGVNTGLNTSGSNQNEMSSSSNLDLVVSGQKLGRKDASPTNTTPRDANQQHQHSPQHASQQDRQKPFTRRLQPLDKLAEQSSPLIANTNENQFLKQKK